MTPEEVEAVVEGAELLEGKGKPVTYGSTDTYWKQVVEAVDFGGVGVTVGYLFKEKRGLQSISIELAEGQTCSDLEKAFEQRFGAGRTVVTKECQMRFTTWDDPATIGDWTQYAGLSADICSGRIKPFEGALEDAPAPKPAAELVPEPEASVNDAGATVIGAWTVQEEKSAFDDSTSIFAFLEAPGVRGSGVGPAELSLMLRCRENTTNLLFLTSMFMTDQSEVMYRIDEQDAVWREMSVSADGKATRFWLGATAILLSAQFTPQRNWPSGSRAVAHWLKRYSTWPVSGRLPTGLLRRATG